MCGILGAFGLSDAALECDVDSFRAQLDTLVHRGPDHDGIRVIDDGTVLGHTRLSILDLSDAGVQPMSDASGRYTIVYNGEVYNHPQLRRALERDGVRFHSTSDTETLLYHLIAHRQDLPRAVADWEGMFAFAFYDRTERSLFLSLDRYGIKPLFYAFRDSTFWFASEIKALLGAVEGRLDISSFSALCQRGFLESFRFTLIEGIERLEPGHYLKLYSGGRSERGVCFDLRSFVDAALYRHYEQMPFSEVTEEFGKLFSNSVNAHMLSDAPLATINSGGVDSSTVSAVAVGYDPDITMYHADVVGRKTSELASAKRIAGHLNGKLQVAPLDDTAWIEAVVKSVYHSEVPLLYHANSVPLFVVCELMRRDGIKSVLTGEGADGLFFGYDELVRKPYLDTVSSVSGMLNKSIRRVPGIGRLLWPAPGRSIPARLQSRYWFEEEELDNAEPFGFITDRKERAHQAAGMRYMRVHLYSLLHRNDRMGMAHSIESRFPFLHSDVVRFGLNLPVKHKVKLAPRIVNRKHPLRVDKAPLRYFARTVIPTEIAFRAKLGFPVRQQRRLHCNSGFFSDGFLQREFKITDRQLQIMLDETPAPEHATLFFLEVWGRLYALRQAVDEVERHTWSTCSLLPS
jgi:asparagine synthase (glutamine-hydrolysing)